MNKKLFLSISLLAILISFIIFTNNSIYFKFLSEVVKINQSLPTVSSDFYNDPITDITYKDITYKTRNGVNLKLDIYGSNNTTTPSPVILYVFGNGWTDGDKVIPSGIKPIINLLQEEGYTIISTSYELIEDDIILDKQISDIKDTIRWIYKNGNTYNLDTTNIGIIAPSAGAQLSMVAAFSDENEFIDDLSLSSYPSKVKYIIDLFGPTTLSDINLSKGPIEITEKLTNSNLEKLSSLYSPINYIDYNLPDTLIIHSLNDDIVPYSTSMEFYNKALEYDNDFKFYTLNNCTHYLENLSEDEALSLYMTILNYIIDQTKWYVI